VGSRLPSLPLSNCVALRYTAANVKREFGAELSQRDEKVRDGKVKRECTGAILGNIHVANVDLGHFHGTLSCASDSRLLIKVLRGVKSLWEGNLKKSSRLEEAAERCTNSPSSAS